MAKRWLSIALALVVLVSSVFLCPVSAAADNETADRYAFFYIDAPSETLDADTVEVTVSVYIPEGVRIGGLQMYLDYYSRYFYCTKSDIKLGDTLGNLSVDDSVHFEPDRLKFMYQNIATELVPGHHTLFTVRFNIRDYAQEDECEFYLNIFELYDDTVDTGDLISFSDSAKVYIGERFKVTPSTATMYIGDTLLFGFNKSVNYEENFNPDIVSYENGLLTALSKGNATLSFISDTGETATVSIRILDRKDAQLTSLKVTNATLSPAFKPGIYHYTATIPYSAEQLEVQPGISSDSTAKVDVSNPKLAAGETGDVTVTVTIKGGYSNIYTISVTREAPSNNCNLKSLTVLNAALSPAFQPGVYAYKVNVPYTADRLELQYAAAESHAKVNVNHPALTAGAVTNVTLTVTAEDGVSQRTYVISVTRAAPPYPNQITSSKYTAGNTYISKITAGTTVSTLISGINEKQYVKVYRANGTLASANDLVGTGFTVRLFHGNTEKLRRTVVVTGDVNGDGKITASDYVNIKFDVLGKTKLSAAASVSGDVNNDGKVTASDYVKIKFYVLGKGGITAR